MKKLSYIKYILSKVKYLFEININCMGSVIDLNDWRLNSMQGPVCAIAGCPNKPTNQCPKCSTYYCFEHVKSHLHMERPEDRHDQNDDINRMR
jgi:hypothetical protein